MRGDVISYIDTLRCAIKRARGYDAAHTTKNVTLDRVRVNGKSITAGSPNVIVGEHTENITFIAADQDELPQK